MPRSSACTISSFASPGYPSLSARDLGAVWAFARTPAAASTISKRDRNLRMFEFSPHKKSGFRGGGRGARAFHVRVEPIIHLPEHVQDRFAPLVAVRLKRQEHEANGGTMSFQCAEKPFALNRESSVIVVRFAMDQQNWCLDFVRVGEGRHFVVHLRRLPVGAIFILKAERRERAIVSAAARDACFEEVTVRQQVGGHKSSIGMPHHRDAIVIDDSKPHAFINGRLGAGDELFHIGIVRLRFSLANNRNRGVFQHSISLRDERNGRAPGQKGKRVGRSSDLPSSRSGLVFRRVGLHQRRKRAVLRLVARRQIKIRGKLDAIRSLVMQYLFLRTWSISIWIWKVGNLLSAGISDFLREEIRTLLL